jgi:CRP/FNR family transcriptional regulator, cyclic AMP receptor protein
MQTLEATLSPDALSLLEIIPKRKLIRYKTGTPIFHAGDPNDYIYYVDVGRIKVSIVSKDGKEAVIGLVTPGQFLGESALMDYPKRMAEATCLTECRLWRFEKNQVLQLLRENKQFSNQFLRYLLERNRRYEEDIAAQRFNCSEKRLARALLLLAHLGESGSTKTVPAVSHQTLAELVGTTRARITGFMSHFRELGYIEYDRRNLTVHERLVKVLVHE